MGNPETLATLSTQDTGQRQAKHTNTTQKIKRWATRKRQKPEVNPGAHEG